MSDNNPELVGEVHLSDDTLAALTQLAEALGEESDEVQGFSYQPGADQLKIMGMPVMLPPVMGDITIPIAMQPITVPIGKQGTPLL
jgi:hypothetical protein